MRDFKYLLVFLSILFVLPIAYAVDINNVSPTDGATNLMPPVTLNVTLYDNPGWRTFNVTFYLGEENPISWSWVNDSCSEPRNDTGEHIVDEKGQDYFSIYLSWTTYSNGGTMYKNYSIPEDVDGATLLFYFEDTGYIPPLGLIYCYNNSDEDWETLYSSSGGYSGEATADILADCLDEEELQIKILMYRLGQYCTGSLSGTHYESKYYGDILVWNKTSLNILNNTPATADFSDLIFDSDYQWYIKYQSGVFSEYSLEWTSAYEFSMLGEPVFDNCSNYTDTALLLNLLDEESQSEINGTIYAVITTEDYGNYSFSTTNSKNLSVCVYPNIDVDVSEIFIEYSSSSHVTENYFLYDTVLSDGGTTINLYDLNSSDSTSFEVSVLDRSYKGLSNAYIKMLRYYPAENQYKLTEVGKTDSGGQTLLHLVLEDVYYIFIIEEDGEVIYSSEPSKRYCSDTPCTLSISTADSLTSIWESLEDVSDFEYSITYNDTSRRVRAQYSDTSGSLSYVQLVVRIPAMVSEEEILCDVNSTDASGVLFCNLNETSMQNASGTFFVDFYISRSPLTETLESIALSFTTFLKTSSLFTVFDPGTIGSEGLVWGVFLIIALVLMGVFNPKLAIMFGCIAVGLVGFLGIIQMSYTAIMAIIAIGVIIIALIKRGEKYG